MKDNHQGDDTTNEENIKDNQADVTSSSELNRSTSSSSQDEDNLLSEGSRVWTSLVAGAVAGALAKTAIAPLDRTKIYFQTSSSSRFSTLAVLKYLQQTWRTDGVVALFRGNSATMARIVPYAAIQFTAHEQWKRVLHVDSSSSSRSSELLRFAAGSLAGVTAQSLTYPLDLTRARLAVSPKCKYRSLSHVFVRVFTEEGPERGGGRWFGTWKVLYRGYVPTMMGVVPYAGFSFYTYETLKRKYKSQFKHEAPHHLRLLFGAVSGVLGQSSSYPFDIVRRRMQVGKVPPSARVFPTILDILRREGLKGGLYKGLSMNWLKGPVAAGISFSVFDATQTFLRGHVLIRNNQQQLQQQQKTKNNSSSSSNR